MRHGFLEDGTLCSPLHTIEHSSIELMKIFTVTLSKQEVPPEIMGNVCDQIQQIQKVPKRLDEYTAEEIQAFPRLFDW